MGWVNVHASRWGAVCDDFLYDEGPLVPFDQKKITARLLAVTVYYDSSVWSQRLKEAADLGVTLSPAVMHRNDLAAAAPKM